MEKTPLLKRLLAGTLAVTVAVSSMTFAVSAESGSVSLSFKEVSNDVVSAAIPGRETMSAGIDAPYADDESVRVSIVLDGESTIASGFEVEDIAENTAAMSYRENLQSKQDRIVGDIERAIDGELDVVWNLTLAANLISANVEYGQIENIEKVNGVKEVLIETQYYPDVISEKPVTDPNMATSSAQIGSNLAWAAGYTGAGSRIAIVDTGTDTDHQSFAEAGYIHSLEQNAKAEGVSYEEYVKSLNLLTKAEVESVKDQLNAGKKDYWAEGAEGTVDSDMTFLTQKLPYAYNYVDHDYDVNHDNDTQGEHGSHVAGIATANSWIRTSSGYQQALTYAHTQGVAPDAQLLTMKVFGKGGGAYDSDYMAAIEDAIILKADSINLSLGSGNPGRSRSSTAAYQEVMDNLAESGVVVAMSAGNSGYWAENTSTTITNVAGKGYLYAEDVSMQMDGSPGSFTNSLATASIDNIGSTGMYIEAADESVIFFSDTSGDYAFDAFESLEGKRGYILIDGFGTDEDWAALKDVLKGKIAICSRGTTSFFEKANAAIENGAIATIIYNNADGVININPSGYLYTQPLVSITKVDGAVLKANAEVKNAGDAVYYEGTLTVHKDMASAQINDGNVMSDFSSWGIPGSLQLKPEITAPGGNIYSVNGAVAGGTAYENMSGTSMASPQIAGMSAVAAEYIRENGLVEKTGLSARTLIQSLLMSTAVPVMYDETDDEGNPTGEKAYYPVIQQGAGLANISNVIGAESYILMGEDATVSAADGKVKAELGDDPDRKGEYTFTFSINNITDEHLAYNLSADLFTQTPFMFYVNQNADTGLFMDTGTMLLDSEATFVCDGETVKTVSVPANGSKTVTVTLKIGAEDLKDLNTIYTNGFYVEGYVYAVPTTTKYDFNGDGKVDDNDAQALLDYRTTVNEGIYNKASADIDGNGVIDTRDAYLFLDLLNSGKLELGEGELLTTHSIPVLGFCGNWTDPSMFDVGTRLEYNSGTEVRDPYLGNKNVNSFGVTYANEPESTYYFGGNPIIKEPYNAERTALNSNDSIAMVSFAAIRNAEESVFEVTKGSDTVAGATLGSVDAAFYHTNQGRWYYTSNTKQIGFVPADAGLKDGDEVTISYSLIPEYYMINDGKELGEGASMSLPVTIDDTLPVVDAVKYDKDRNIITVTASDNQYIAGVLLYNRSGSVLYSLDGSKEKIAKGEKADYVLDVEGLKGTKFIIQVVDYANNIRTYECEENVGADIPLPDIMGINTGNSGSVWASVIDDTTAENAKTAEVYMPSEFDFVAATIAEHYIFAVTEGGDIYVMPENDLDNMSKVGSTPYGVADMAYNPVDGGVYAVLNIETSSVLAEIDKLTGEIEPICAMPDTLTLACDENGIFYFNPAGTDTIKGFTLDENTEVDENNVLIPSIDLCDEVGIGGSSTRYQQAMEVNPNNNHLVWMSINAFSECNYVEVLLDGEEAGTTLVCDFPTIQIYSLVIPDKTPATGTPDWAKPTNTASQMLISEDSVELFKNGKTQLSAEVKPWTLTDKTIVWTSSDESVATVSANGTVNAIKAGKATITASSKSTPSVKATCEVTVSNIEITVTGALQDAEGKAQFYKWNMETEDTWTGGEKLSLGGEITSATASDKHIYIGTSDEAYYQIDPATGETLDQGSGSFGAPYSDIAYSRYFSTDESPKTVGVAEYYAFVPSDPVNPVPQGWNLGMYLLIYTGSSNFIAVANMGETELEEEDGSVTLTERFVALTDNGALWSLYMSKNPATGEADSSVSFDFCMTNLPSNFLGSNTYGEYCSMVCGDDGYLYLSAHDGNTNNFYRLEVNDDLGTCTAVYMGNVGDGVWPATITNVTSNKKAASVATRVSASDMLGSHLIDAEVELENIDLGEVASVSTPAIEALTAEASFVSAAPSVSVMSVEQEEALENLVVPQADTATETVAPVDPDVKDMSVTVECQKENGLLIVDYDQNVLDLDELGVDTDAELHSFKIDKTNGKVIFGYVAEGNVEDGKTAALTLTFKADANTNATTSSVNVIKAEEGELNIVPTEADVNTYDPKVDGYSESAKEYAEKNNIDLDNTVNGEATIVIPQAPDSDDNNFGNDVVISPIGGGSSAATTTAAEAEATTTAPTPAGTDNNTTNTNAPSVVPEVSLDVNDPSVPVNTGNIETTPGNTSGNGSDQNMNTGVVLFIAPVAVSAIAVLVSKKRRK